MIGLVSNEVMSSGSAVRAMKKEGPGTSFSGHPLGPILIKALPSTAVARLMMIAITM
nr:hypothetical protein [bacterium]